MAPPKPRLVLRIGVTGHRPNRFGSEAQARVAAKLTDVFRRIAESMAALQRREADVFSDEPPQIRVVSALAEGADRVVAEVALAAGFPLDVVLPFPPAIYAEDFVTADAKNAFAALLAKAATCSTLPGTRSPADPDVANRAYEAAGLMTLRHSDFVVAVWDGGAAAGRGGTGAVIQAALANGQPVLRFDALGEGPFFCTASGSVDARAVAGPITTPADDATITALIERLCVPPGAKRLF